MHILFVSTQSPYAGAMAREMLDFLLLATAYPHEISLFFTEEGVCQLVSGLSPQEIGLKHFTAAYQALPLYGVSKVYVDRQALEERKLCREQLVIAAEILNDGEITELFNKQDQVFYF